MKDVESSFLKLHPSGTTTFLEKMDEPMEKNCSYRQVIDPDKVMRKVSSNELFTDGEYIIDQGVEFKKSNDEIIVRRLSTLYSSTNRPEFFDLKRKVSRPKDPKNMPKCFGEMPLFDTLHYKTFFVTQSWQENGRYVLIINRGGRFQYIEVDDNIPFNAKTMEPYWDMDLQSPWEIILMKAWAKNCGGYEKVERRQPSEFLQAFHNSCWKYFNLTRDDGQEFLKRYDPSKLNKALVVLKTKNNKEVEENGLIANSLSYKLLNYADKTNNQAYVVAIRSTSVTHWTGQMSFFDEKVTPLFTRTSKYDINLERDFFMTGEDFLNNFSAAYVAAVHSSSFVTGADDLEVKPNETNAQHFEFTVREDTFFDFSIRQAESNLITDNSGIKASSLPENKRFLKMKYLLVKDENVFIQKKESESAYAG